MNITRTHKRVQPKNAAGETLWRETFTPYGETWGSPPAANDNQQGFTGHIRDSDTGLTYMQARYYDPVIGRFLSNDPVGFAEGGVDYFNRYAYTANDPVNLIDPDGRRPRRARRNSRFSSPGVGIRFRQAQQEFRQLNSALGQRGDLALPSGPGSITMRSVRNLENINSELRIQVMANATPLRPDGTSPTDTGFTRVGRNMSPAEATAMQETGRVQENTNGTGMTHVSVPPTQNAQGRTPPSGSVFVEFTVPTESLRPSSSGAMTIPGPNSIQSRAAQRRGEPPLQLPEATDIQVNN